MGLVYTDDVTLLRIVAIIERQRPTHLGGSWTRIIRAHQRALRALGVSEGDASEEAGWLFYEVWTRSPKLRERLPTPAFVRRVREGHSRADWEASPASRTAAPWEGFESSIGPMTEATWEGSFRGPGEEPRVVRSAETARIPKFSNPGSGSVLGHAAGPAPFGLVGAKQEAEAS